MTQSALQVPKLDQATYMFTCMDGPDTGPLRLEHLEGHLVHIENNNEKYRVAGPMRKDSGGDIAGSFFLIAADSEAQAWDIMRGDPYIESGMYASITVHHIVPACGAWMGGVIWDRETLIKNHPR